MLATESFPCNFQNTELIFTFFFLISTGLEMHVNRRSNFYSFLQLHNNIYRFCFHNIFFSDLVSVLIHHQVNVKNNNILLLAIMQLPTMSIPLLFSEQMHNIFLYYFSIYHKLFHRS